MRVADYDHPVEQDAVTDDAGLAIVSARVLHFDRDALEDDGRGTASDAIEAVTYYKKGRAPEAPPSEEYVKVIREGYRDWGLV